MPGELRFQMEQNEKKNNLFISNWNRIIVRKRQTAWDEEMWHYFLIQLEIFFVFYLRQSRNYFGINFLIWATSWQRTCLSCQWRELTYKLPFSIPAVPPFLSSFAFPSTWLGHWNFSFHLVSFHLVCFHFGLVILTNENNIWYAKHMWRNRIYAPYSPYSRRGMARWQRGVWVT